MLPMAEITLTTIGAGIIVAAAAAGIATIFWGGLKSVARQPELQAKLQTQMIIGAAFIEGAALFALVVCLMKG